MSSDTPRGTRVLVPHTGSGCPRRRVSSRRRPAGTRSDSAKAWATASRARSWARGPAARNATGSG
ncbi:hypothetical protein ACFZB4_33730 [Streptomyces pseudovenezuelae]|uniref:hypothetical protein n=1 Tax=Streptomyces pseudovenezuelae TaxID=67350 RepID=UPI0036E5DDB3